MSRIRKFPNERILVISDTHFPYEDERMWDFIQLMKMKHVPDMVVHTGDIVDFYAASRYPKDPDHPDSFPNELIKIKKSVKRLARIFPKMRVTVGNHDFRLRARSQNAGLPVSTVKSLPRVLGAPKGWRFYEEEMTLSVESTGEKITFAHHLGANTTLEAQRLGRTVLTGHQHSKGHVTAFNNGESIYFGCNVPNLINNTGAPFSYTTLSHINPVRGCIIINSGIPNLEILR